MKRRMTAAEYAKKWKERAAAASAAYKEGVGRVTENPGEAAAAAADRMLAGVQEAVSSGYYQDRCRAVSLTDWKSKSQGKGSTNYVTGVNAAEADMVRNGGPALEHVYNTAERVNQMPATTLEERIAKAVENIRGNAEYKKRR